tara:strand:+ start:6174 stop:6440 length:267 start_codon:yes stop_codon:yes gene_type:complete
MKLISMNPQAIHKAFDSADVDAMRVYLKLSANRSSESRRADDRAFIDACKRSIRYMNKRTHRMSMDAIQRAQRAIRAHKMLMLELEAL